MRFPRISNLGQLSVHSDFFSPIIEIFQQNPIDQALNRFHILKTRSCRFHLDFAWEIASLGILNSNFREWSFLKTHESSPKSTEASFGDMKTIQGLIDRILLKVFDYWKKEIITH